MDIISLAREIGFAIQNDEDYINFKIKEQNAECDKELQKIIEEFNLKKVSINHEISKENSNNDKIDLLNKEIGDLYQAMNSNSTMEEYKEAKNKFDQKLKKVSLIINSAALGQDPYGVDVESDAQCTGSCASCQGCN